MLFKKRIVVLMLLLSVVVSPLTPSAEAASLSADRVSSYIVGAIKKAIELSRSFSDRNLAAVSGVGSGLVGHWTLDAISGNTFPDSSGSGNLGTAEGIVSTSAGTISNAVLFNGSNQRIIIGNQSAVNLSQGTISAWIKTPAAGSNFRSIIAKQSAYGMFLFNNEFGVYDWGSQKWSGSGVTLNDGAWHHVACSFSSGVQNGTKCFVDGIQKISTTILVQNQGERLMIAEANAGQYFAGSIDDVRLYNRTLSAEEIFEVMGVATPAPTPVPPAPPQAPLPPPPPPQSAPQPLPPSPQPAPTISQATFFLGESILAIANVNVRSDHSITSTLVTTKNTNSQGIIISSPVLQDGITWYQIMWPSSGNAIIGWSSAEFIEEEGSRFRNLHHRRSRRRRQHRFLRHRHPLSRSQSPRFLRDWPHTILSTHCLHQRFLLIGLSMRIRESS